MSDFIISTLTEYYQNDQIEEDEMGGTCGPHWEVRIVYRILVRKSEGKRLLGRHKHRWEVNIKVNSKRSRI
jgi:hypothetical protein